MGQVRVYRYDGDWVRPAAEAGVQMQPLGQTFTRGESHPEAAQRSVLRY